MLYAYSIAGEAYHQTCDLYEIDKENGKLVYEAYQQSLESFIINMENTLKLIKIFYRDHK